MEKSDKIFVAGHRGLGGSALVRKLAHDGFTQLVTRDRFALDLRKEGDVARFFAQGKPAVGWRHEIPLREGIARTYQSFRQNNR